ncbi:VIT1/CCC1 transporter family protein [Lacticaseibacillus pantheris]|uniref:VIT1/CCC1 transporter family protein n=1 Tax=Lacticaseibacillus pantheris TaxID=171523 RepID=UPI002592670B|nr:VIT family protein [Lacticaseibacillus pantheris]WKF84697.1 VIT family protein [Lacticaseibacillus pantheris]
MNKKKKGARKLSLNAQINLIRAGVMGANDGILSVAAIVLGVAAANVSTHNILLAGFAGMLAGTISMAMGEYVSVHAQRDAEERATADETQRMELNPQAEVDFVTHKYVAAGISHDLAAKAAQEMFDQAPVVTAVRERYDIDPGEQTSAFGAAIASFISFPLGSLLPMLTISLVGNAWRIPATVASVVIALMITGAIAAKLGNANVLKATVRNVIAGLITMAITTMVGHIFAR